MCDLTHIYHSSRSDVKTRDDESEVVLLGLQKKTKMKDTVSRCHPIPHQTGDIRPRISPLNQSRREDQQRYMEEVLEQWPSSCCQSGFFSYVIQ